MENPTMNMIFFQIESIDRLLLKNIKNIMTHTTLVIFVQKNRSRSEQKEDLRSGLVI